MGREGAVLLAVSAALRVVLIGLGHWQDTHLEVKYTDIDYVVFTDAARFMADGRSPYERATYRYTPLLAAALIPNTVLPVWGKLLFSAADILVGWVAQTRMSGHSSRWGLVCAATWLFNPFTMTISTRGNGEAVVILLLALQLWAIDAGCLAVAGLLYGLVIHWRIYPAIYALSSLLHIFGVARGAVSSSAFWPACIPDVKRSFVFMATAGASFAGLTALCYGAYGQDFLQHSLLYHATRQDHRHNFSLYFYHIYLHWPEATLLSRLALVPQAVCNVALAVAFHKDLPFCWMLQTIAFVAFNKVCTAQYFVWYFGLLPFCLPSLWPKENRLRLGLSVAFWLFSQIHWLAWAYQLEFQGRPFFLPLWAASCVFLCANTLLMLELMRSHWLKRNQQLRKEA
mmetsp:Transcript_33643/g.95145  ORF Transcript_33643/g.95145 Transcript_33643/m.95145 type:complete len:399 (+) Transcript_33643:111-1307(+)|eukprot:CAMPEP_0117653798 /NCGR_PEP_ID=MMETSP0804-20121206/3392_1 /TAXON_ID=1074897 /ORGANISM="Tetraselmis astigmatica, Strain CCMP880" /LENGTH=398 /DNA_ID=CAMNT_0005460015 /DNA_START=85 /DNA_END=1281 /DNA_ORIENTATION=+